MNAVISLFALLQSTAPARVAPVDIHKDWADWVLWGVSVLLVVVGIVGVRFAYRTLRAIEKQTKATEIAAEAARTSANALVGSERAWILETVNFPNDLPVQPSAGNVIVVFVGFTFTNRGRTPARILDIKLRFHTVQTPNILPELPQYDTTSMPELGAYGRMIASGEAINIGRLLEDRGTFRGSDRQAIAESRLSVYAYGIIEYETLGTKASTQFCYEWFEPRGFTSSEEVPGFRKGGPREYNKAT